MRANELSSLSGCQSNMSDSRPVLEGYAQRHNGSYPSRAELGRLTQKRFHHGLKYGDWAYEYRRPPRNAKGSFVVIRCDDVCKGVWPFRRRIVVEMRLDGKVYLDGH